MPAPKVILKPERHDDANGVSASKHFVLPNKEKMELNFISFICVALLFFIESTTIKYYEHPAPLVLEAANSAHIKEKRTKSIFCM